VELGIISLSDIQAGQTARERVEDAIRYARLADRLGLDVFALGEHHGLECGVSSSAVILAAAAARTERILPTSGVSVLPVLDSVRVYEDFAQLDLITSAATSTTTSALKRASGGVDQHADARAIGQRRLIPVRARPRADRAAAAGAAADRAGGVAVGAR
jgi:luciferase-like monooxygenase